MRCAKHTQVWIKLESWFKPEEDEELSKALSAVDLMSLNDAELKTDEKVETERRTCGAETSDLIRL